MKLEHERTRTLHSLLRGELAAVEAYRKALDRLDERPAAERIRGIAAEHDEAVLRLSRFLTRQGDEPDADSGIWGAFARAIEDASGLLGNKSALRALKEGEEHGVKEYERALKDDYLDPEFKSLVRNVYLPRQRAHIVALERLIEDH